MNDQEILESIEFFCESDCIEQAVMIKGSWGIGKTYFIKNKLIPFFKDKDKKRTIIYYSLFGKKDYNSVKRDIKILKMLSHVRMKDKHLAKINEVKKISSRIVSKILSLYSSINIDVNVEFTELLSIENSIIILDDMERCDMKTRELMGLISELVLGDNNLVVVVGNYKEIYLREENATEKISQESETEILKKYRKDFEKNFIMELDYHIDLDEIIQLIFVSDSEEISIFYERNKLVIYSTCKRLQCENFRIIRCAKEMFEYMYKIIKDIDNTFSINAYSDEYDSIFRYMLNRMIQFKLGLIDLENYNVNNNHIYLPLDLDIKENSPDNYILAYGFVDKFIKTGIVDKTVINHYIKKFYKIRNRSFLSLYKEPRWDLLDSDYEILKRVHDLYNEIERKEYELSDVKKIIDMLIYIRYWAKIDFDIEKFQEALKNMITKIEFTLDDYQQFIYSSKISYGSYKSEYKNFALSIESFINNRVEDIKRDQFNLCSYFESLEEFNGNFKDFCIINKDNFYTERKFLSFLPSSYDFCIFVNMISSKEIDILITMFKYIYLEVENYNEFFSDDLPHIKFLKKSVNNQIDKETQKIKKAHLKQLEKILSQIEEGLI